ncbi:24690_t:CDS:1, partial [Gigaspora rosea]
IQLITSLVLPMSNALNALDNKSDFAEFLNNNIENIMRNLIYKKLYCPVIYEAIYNAIYSYYRGVNQSGPD